MILDTNALSALAARDPALRQKLGAATRLSVTLISLGEFHFGLLGSSQREPLERWLEAFLARADLIQPDRETLPHYGAIRHELKTAGTPIPANDVWIAALVRQHRMPIVSRDVHFDHVADLRRIDW